jgi:hypothetical protein
MTPYSYRLTVAAMRPNARFWDGTDKRPDGHVDAVPAFDPFPLAGAVQRRRALKDCRTSDHGLGDNRKLKDRNSVQHEIGENAAAPKW